MDIVGNLNIEGIYTQKNRNIDYLVGISLWNYSTTYKFSEIVKIYNSLNTNLGVYMCISPTSLNNNPLDDSLDNPINWQNVSIENIGTYLNDFLPNFETGLL